MRGVFALKGLARPSRQTAWQALAYELVDEFLVFAFVAAAASFLIYNCKIVLLFDFDSFAV
jgi:hypothetical protein